MVITKVFLAKQHIVPGCSMRNLRTYVLWLFSCQCYTNMKICGKQSGALGFPEKSIGKSSFSLKKNDFHFGMYAQF